MREYSKKDKAKCAHPNAVTHLNNGVYITFSKSNNSLSLKDKYILTVYSNSSNFKKHQPSEIKYMNIDEVNLYLQEELLLNNF